MEVIFPDELKVVSEKPYKYEITINSNAESDDNHLKILLIIELPHDYPQNVPFLRLKNLSPDLLDNRKMHELESQARKMTHEAVGTQMIFDICEHLREGIADINDLVVNKYKEVLEIEAEKERQE